MAAAKKSIAAAAWGKAAAREVVTWSFRAVGCVPIYYASRIAYKASLSQGEDWANVAVCTTIAAALLLLMAEKLLKRRMFAACLIPLTLGIGLAAWSMVITSGNVAALDKAAKASYDANERTTGNLTDQRRDAVDRRDAAKVRAKGETEESAISKIERLGRYPSARKISELKEKAAAAKAYAEAVKDIAAIDAKLGAQGVVAVSTGQTAGVKLAAAITRFSHIELKEGDGEAVFEWGRGGILELLSAIGLAVMDVLAWLMFEAGEAKAEAPKPRVFAPMSEPKPKKRMRQLAAVLSRITSRRKEAAEIIAFPAGSAREFYRRHLEQSDDPKARIPAGAMQSRYAADCESYGVDKRSKTFSQELQKLGVQHVKISGRPYYYGVRWRDVPLPAAAHKGPRVVVDNTWKKVAPAPAAAML